MTDNYSSSAIVVKPATGYLPGCRTLPHYKLCYSYC